jgi:hypothetical protein
VNDAEEINLLKSYQQAKQPGPDIILFDLVMALVNTA